MSGIDRLRGVIAPQRLKALGLPEPEPKTVVQVAAALPADPKQAADDLAAWRAYQAANPFVRATLMERFGEAISRGRALDQELPEPPDAA